MRDIVTVIHELASSESGAGESLGAALAHVLRLVGKKHESALLALFGQQRMKGVAEAAEALGRSRAEHPRAALPS